MFLACMAAKSVESADDVVRVIRARDGEVLEVEGKVVEFDRDAVTIKTVQQQPRVIPFASVLAVDTPLTSSHELGRQQFDQGNWNDAINSLGLAFQRERRNWVRQQVLRDLALAYRYSGNIQRSASTALTLYRDYPRTNQLDALPLSWGVGEDSAPNKASQWMGSRAPSAKLLGASWLLSGKSREQSLSVLRGLSESSDPWIAQLATAQLWRTELPNATKAKCERWSRLVSRMSPSLRAGPLYILGCAWDRAGDQDRAAVTLMKVPVLHPDAKGLSVNALMKTAELVGNEERVAVYREVVARHARSNEASIARQELDSIQKKVTDG